MISQTLEQLQQRNFAQPDDTRIFEKGKIELITMGDVTFGRATLQPGWKWSTCVKPIAGTDFCEAAHLQYQVSGRLHVQMRDGTTVESGPGDVVSIPHGHDAWVIGREPVVVIDISGLKDYAKSEAP